MSPGVTDGFRINLRAGSLYYFRVFENKMSNDGREGSNGIVKIIIIYDRWPVNRFNFLLEGVKINWRFQTSCFFCTVGLIERPTIVMSWSVSWVVQTIDKAWHLDGTKIWSKYVFRCVAVWILEISPCSANMERYTEVWEFDDVVGKTSRFISPATIRHRVITFHYTRWDPSLSETLQLTIYLVTLSVYLVFGHRLFLYLELLRLNAAFPM